MQMVSMGSVLAGPTSGLSDLFSPFLAVIPAGSTIMGLIVSLIIAIPLGFIIGSIPMWLAAKIAVPGKTRYTQALGIVVSQFLANLLIVIIGAMAKLIGGFVGGQNAAFSVQVLFWIIMFVAGILIVAGYYGIGTIHAFAVQLLSVVIVFGAGALIYFGLPATRGVLAASVQNLRNGQSSSNVFASLPSFGNSPSSSASAPAPVAFPVVGSNSAEIDALLNAALHPNGPKLSLAERENIVRTLQEKLKAEQSSLSEGDAHAVLVFQNQRNRYLALLETVKSELKLHPHPDPTHMITEKPLGRDYASPESESVLTHSK